MEPTKQEMPKAIQAVPRPAWMEAYARGPSIRARIMGAPKTSGWDLEWGFALYGALILGPIAGYVYGRMYDKEHKLLATGKGLLLALILFRVWSEVRNPVAFAPKYIKLKMPKGYVYPEPPNDPIPW